MVLLVEPTYHTFSRYLYQLTPVLLMVTQTTQIILLIIWKKSVELLTAKMTRLEWALNKTLVFAATADRPGAREHDVSVYGPLHSCLRKIRGARRSPAIGEYRTLDKKESSDSKNDGTIVLSAYSCRDIKELFLRVTCKSIDSHVTIVVKE